MKDQILNLYSNLQDSKNYEITADDRKLIQSVMDELDQGKIRVCEKINSNWVTHEWVKKAILLYFRITTNQVIHAGDLSYFDKIPVKKFNESHGVRVVPQAIARYASYIEAGAILMPSYVNIGAYVGSGTTAAARRPRC